MANRAQLSQERSRQRRDQLLAAAIELFAEGGTRAVTHRAVAARAGLPAATTTYYFGSIEELVREALAAHITQWMADLKAFMAVDFEIDVDLDEAAGFVSTIFAARGPEVAALELGIYLAAARDPELRDSATEALESFERLAEKILRGVGLSEPGTLPATIIALIAGTAVRRQSGQYSEIEEARLLTGAVRDLVGAHLIGADGIEQALRGVLRT